MVSTLQDRLPIVVNYFLFVTMIQFSHSLCYSVQVILNLCTEGSNFAINPTLLTIELIIELLLCVTISVALWTGHRRYQSTSSETEDQSRVSTRKRESAVSGAPPKLGPEMEAVLNPSA